MSQAQNLILREANGVEIGQRPVDGYFDATAMCRSHGKLYADYRRLGSTEEFLNELSLNMGIPIIELIQSQVGAHGGTWVHPVVAVHLAQWCSPRFAVAVAIWVNDLRQDSFVTPDRDDLLCMRHAVRLEIEPFERRLTAFETNIVQLGPYLSKAVAAAVKEHVPKPRNEFTQATTNKIVKEYLRQNPTGLDPTGKVRIIDVETVTLMTSIADLHHMYGPYLNGYRHGLPVTRRFHQKLTADKAEQGEEWRKARTAHQNFLDKSDFGEPDLLDFLDEDEP